MKHTETQLRDLDAWVAEHVMGCNLDWHRGGLRDEPHCACGYTKDDKPSGIVMPYPHAEYRGDGRHLGTFGPDPTRLMHYSTDPAAAFQVLEKCAEKLMQETGLAIYKTTTGYAICCDDTGDITAQTLPLTICLFAQQLFGK